MAILLPSVPWNRAYPQIMDEGISVSRSGGRAVSYVEFEDPYWQVQVISQPLKQADRKLLEAFISKCKRGMVTVHFVPTDVCIPRFYWGNKNAPALADTGVITAITNRTVISFNSVTTGLTLKDGDLIGLTVGDYNYIVRVCADAVAVAGAINNLPVDPPLPSYITVGAVVTFKDPKINMRYVPGSFSMPDENFPVARFVLTEVPK